MDATSPLLTPEQLRELEQVLKACPDRWDGAVAPRSRALSRARRKELERFLALTDRWLAPANADLINALIHRHYSAMTRTTTTRGAEGHAAAFVHELLGAPAYGMPEAFADALVHAPFWPSPAEIYESAAKRRKHVLEVRARVVRALSAVVISDAWAKQPVSQGGSAGARVAGL